MIVESPTGMPSEDSTKAGLPILQVPAADRYAVNARFVAAGSGAVVRCERTDAVTSAAATRTRDPASPGSHQGHASHTSPVHSLRPGPCPTRSSCGRVLAWRQHRWAIVAPVPGTMGVLESAGINRSGGGDGTVRLGSSAAAGSQDAAEGGQVEVGRRQDGGSGRHRHAGSGGRPAVARPPPPTAFPVLEGRPGR